MCIIKAKKCAHYTCYITLFSHSAASSHSDPNFPTKPFALVGPTRANERKGKKGKWTRARMTEQTIYSFLYFLSLFWQNFFCLTKLFLILQKFIWPTIFGETSNFIWQTSFGKTSFGKTSFGVDWLRQSLPWHYQVLHWLRQWNDF